MEYRPLGFFKVPRIDCWVYIDGLVLAFTFTGARDGDRVRCSSISHYVGWPPWP
jgi:hypothetical protein